MTKWVCYLLKSVDSNKTYIGATDNLYRRLCDHNGLHGKSKGAKATKGKQWIVILFISGFKNRIGCLSFETGVKKIKKRKHKAYIIKGDPIQKKIIAYYNLLYLGSNLNKWDKNNLQMNLLETKYHIDYLKLPTNVSYKLGITNVNKDSLG